MTTPETDEHLIAAVRDFDWPCGKRIAHGPHVSDGVVMCGIKIGAYDCPGVKAHPAVMIGRKGP